MKLIKMIDHKHYRRRLYQNYLTTHAQTNLGNIHQDLESRAPYLKSLIQQWFPNEHNIKVLDLGCGYGALLYFLKEAGYHDLQGVDSSPEQVACARQLGLGFVRNGDILETLEKSEDCLYDVLIAFDVLEHFSKDEVLIFVDEAYRALKSGGRLLIHVPNGEAIFSGAVFFGDLTHETCFTRQSLRQLMSIAGFNSMHVIEDVPVVHGIKSAVRYVLWRLFRTVFRLIYMAETGDRAKDLVLSQNMLAMIEKE